MESLLDILYLQEYHKIRKGKQTFHLFKKGVCCEKSFRRIKTYFYLNNELVGISVLMVSTFKSCNSFVR
jgi:hypothetical protein